MNLLLRSLVRRIRGQQYRRYAAFAVSAGLLAVLLARLLLTMTGSSLVIVGLSAGSLVFLCCVLTGWSVRVTPRRLAAHLDRRFPELEESTMLLVQPESALSPIENLQAQRTETVLLGLVSSHDIAAPFAAKVPTAWAYSLLCVAVVANLQFLPVFDFRTNPSRAALPLVVDSIQVDIQPPDYTQLPASRLRVASFEVPEGSLVRFTLAFGGTVQRAAIKFDGSTDASLYPAKTGLWQSQWLPVSSNTYQVWADGEPVSWPGGSTTQGIALIADEPPDVRLLDPAARLVLAAPDDALPLNIRVAVSDDFGLAKTYLEVTRSAGSGEQVSFETTRIDWTEQLPSEEKSTEIEASIALPDLGFTANTELYLQVVTLDNRPVAPLEGRSQTIIVRPPAIETAADLVIDNPIIQVMPEYFRSQRQIIIDSEALIADRDSISEADFSQRAQSLAIDQKALRLRYGEFMGEEQSGEPSAGPSDEDHFVGDGHDHDDEHDAADDPAEEEHHFVGDGHDHGDDFGPQMSAEDRFADAATAVEAYSHFHDQEEQATLFDPETRGLLSQALSAMWSSEAELRQFEPKPALPHQYRALALLKRVQRRSRALARRVGVAITPIDPERRLTGELDDIRKEAVLTTPDRDDVVTLALHDAALDLFEDVGSPDPSSFEALDAWLSVELLTRGVDAKALVQARSALNDWRDGSACADCRDLLKRFWRQHAPLVGALPGRSESPPNMFGESG